MKSGHNDKRIRVTGTIEHSPRGPLLRCADDDVWKLELEDIDLPTGASEIIVEGHQSGLDEITVDWIGESSHP